MKLLYWIIFPTNIYIYNSSLKFNLDKKLYVTTGDTNNSNIVQNLDLTGKKRLRLNSDGMVSTVNLYFNYIYSYGYCNFD